MPIFCFFVFFSLLSYKITIEFVDILWSVAHFSFFGFFSFEYLLKLWSKMLCRFFNFMAFFLWLSFKIGIEKADLCWQTMRNLRYRVFVFLPFFRISYKIISVFYARRTGPPSLPSAHSCIVDWHWLCMILYYILLMNFNEAENCFLTLTLHNAFEL